MKTLIIALILSVILSTMAYAAPERIILTDSNGNEYSSTNPIYVQGV